MDLTEILLNFKNAHLVAVNADDKSAFVAGPVEVEESSLTNITHLSNLLHNFLPHNFLICNETNKKLGVIDKK
jgi:hypothetical protein